MSGIRCRKCGTTWDTGQLCPECHTPAEALAAIVCLGAATVVYTRDQLTMVCNRLETKGWTYRVFWATPYAARVDGAPDAPLAADDSRREADRCG